MKKILLALIALVFSAPLYAGCNEYALFGEWSVFYRNNDFPTSVLAPDKLIDIRYDRKLDQFSVAFKDDHWKAWAGGWTHECIDRQTVLIGALERRGGGIALVVEISKVTNVSDLLARSSGTKKLNQINIRFPERQDHGKVAEIFDALQKNGYLASHPGHAHADEW
jgi:hypothetical protein